MARPASTARLRRTRLPLTRERILDAALAIVDQDGYDALTMRSLGQELGVEAMSLYHHFPNKDRLVAGLADRVTSEFQLGEGGGDWREDLRRAGRSCWSVVMRHPNALPALVASPLVTEQSPRRLSEIILRILGRAGLDTAEAHRMFRVLQALLIGAGFMFRARPDAAAIEAQVRDLDRSETPYPLLRKALTSPEILEREQDFEAGLEALILGIEAVARPAGVRKRR